MSGPMLTISDLLRDAADALEEAYRGREDVPPASLALIVALRERVEHITAGKTVLDEPEPTAATVTQDGPQRLLGGGSGNAPQWRKRGFARRLCHCAPPRCASGTCRKCCSYPLSNCPADREDGRRHPAFPDPPQARSRRSCGS